MRRLSVDRTRPINGFNLKSLVGFFVPLVLVSGWMLGCKKEDIHSYRVPRQPEIEKSMVAQPSNASPTPSNVVWTIPTAWHEVETTVSMRIATFHAGSEIEISVAAFPGDVGGLLANVNRWRGQVGLDPSDEQSVDESIEEIDGSDVIVVDVTGDTVRLIGSIINIGDGKTWFVKATGESGAIEAIKADLVAFSVSFHLNQADQPNDESAQQSTQPAAQPATQPATQETIAPVDGAQTIAWEQPSEWSVDPNASSILSAAYFSQSGARITLTELGGQGGGLMSNINRWRGQLGLGSIGSMSEQPVRDLGNGSLIVDLKAADGSGRIMAGIVPVGGRTLFFKLTGTVEQTDPEINRFETYIHAQGTGRQGAP